MNVWFLEWLAKCEHKNAAENIEKGMGLICLIGILPRFSSIICARGEKLNYKSVAKMFKGSKKKRYEGIF